MSYPSDPFAWFSLWLDEAGETEVNNPNAVALATADADGRPSVRMVLCKDHGPDVGFVFYTNFGSRKAQELDANPHAGLVFHWKSRNRQVRAEGRIERVDDATADAYFASRARTSQLGAWASKQSQPLEGRFELERRVARVTARFPLGAVPRPEFWGGYRLWPERIEFWEERPYRLHLRRAFHRAEGGWEPVELFP